MKLYITENGAKGANTVVPDDMILTKTMPTSAGSKMLEGYQGLFDAEVITRLTNAGYEIGGKLFIMANDTSVSNLAGARFFFFNKNLVKDYQLTSPHTYIQDSTLILYIR